MSVIPGCTAFPLAAARAGHPRGIVKAHTPVAVPFTRARYFEDQAQIKQFPPTKPEGLPARTAEGFAGKYCRHNRRIGEGKPEHDAQPQRLNQIEEKSQK